MPIISARAQLAAEIEAVEGAAEVLAAADCVLVENPVFKPVTPPIERKPVSSSLSPYASVAGHRHATIEFDAELKGSGTAGNAIELTDILRACGWAETLVGGVSATYLPASSSIPCVTMAIYEDGLKKMIWGARGTFKLSCLSDNYCKFHFIFTGADYSITDVALLGGLALQSTKPPAFINASMTVHTYAALLGKLEFDLGNTMALRKDANSASGYKSVVITGRKPKLTFDPEHVLVATHDWYGRLRSGTEAALTATVGATAGNICTITAPKVQYQEITEEDREGVRTLGISCQLNRNSGDDELSLAYT